MDRVSPNSLTNQEEGEVAETAIATERKINQPENKPLNNRWTLQSSAEEMCVCVHVDGT